MIKVQTFENPAENQVDMISYKFVGAYFLHKAYSDGPFNPIYEVPTKPDEEVVVTFGTRTGDASGNTDGLSDAIDFTDALADMLTETPSVKNKAAIGRLLSDIGAVIARSEDSSVGMFGLRVNAASNGEFEGSFNSSPFLSLSTGRSIVSEAVRRTQVNALNKLDALLGVRADEPTDTFKLSPKRYTKSFEEINTIKDHAAKLTNENITYTESHIIPRSERTTSGIEYPNLF